MIKAYDKPFSTKDVGQRDVPLMYSHMSCRYLYPDVSSTLLLMKAAGHLLTILTIDVISNGCQLDIWSGSCAALVTFFDNLIPQR